MSRKILTTALLIFLTATVAFGQTKTYVGGRVAVVRDVYELVDNGNGLKNVTFMNGLWGINVRQEWNDRLYLETGLFRKYYSEGVVFKIEDGHGSSNAIEAWLIPLRLGTKINLSKEKIFLVPVIGYSYCINSDYDKRSLGGGIGGVRTGSDSARYTTVAARYDFTKTFPLLQTGMGLEFRLLKTALLPLSANYYTGFKKVVQRDIRYTVNNSPEQAATAFSKGEFFSVDIGVQYPVSNFWTKAKR